MQKEFITTSSAQTQSLGHILAQELQGGDIICLEGELGAGKTTFTQGLLEGLGAEKPYTSPTFVIIKEYDLKNKKTEIKKAYHFDAYRVSADDILALGWEEIIAETKNIVIIEWASRVKNIIPPDAIWVDFEWKGEKERKIKLSNVQ